MRLSAAWFAVLAAGFPPALSAQPDDPAFLRALARDVVEASRVKPGQRVGSQPANSLGFALIKPGGGGSYPSFWIRDFAMSLASGQITAAEIRNHFGLIARCQNGPSERKLLHGLVLPPFAIPDHINFDGRPVFYPGTYSSGEDQGRGGYGFLPPVDGHYDFVHIAWHLSRITGSRAFLQDTVGGMTLRGRLEAAFASPRSDSLTGLVVTDSARRAVGFGFCDAIHMRGNILFPSLLRYRAAGELADLLAADPEAASRYRRIQETIRAHLAPTFGAPARIRGWLQAATEVGRQPDVWGSLYALHLGVLPPAARDTLLGTVAEAVRRGTIAYQGAVRHVPTDMDASPTSAWERTGVKLNTYQNGAYWHTPTGWLIKALERKDAAAAAKLSGEFLQHLRQGDFRQGGAAKAPWECFAPGGYAQNGVYMTSVTVPLAVLSAVPASIGNRPTLRIKRDGNYITGNRGLDGRRLGPAARRQAYMWSAEEALTRLSRSW